MSENRRAQTIQDDCSGSQRLISRRVILLSPTSPARLEVDERVAVGSQRQCYRRAHPGYVTFDYAASSAAVAGASLQVILSPMAEGRAFVDEISWTLTP